MPSRRQFLQVGLAGSALLLAGRWLGAREAPPRRGFAWLDPRNADAVAAFVPVVLAGAIPAEGPARAAAIRETVAGFDRAVSGLSPSVRREVDDLFGLFRFAPMRIALTGLWSPIEESSPEDLATFLARWRASSFEIQRAAYMALTQLIQAAWYDNPSAWAAIGYPGPPKLS